MNVLLKSDNNRLIEVMKNQSYDVLRKFASAFALLVKLQA
jgi:hypothetical protein